MKTHRLSLVLLASGLTTGAAAQEHSAEGPPPAVFRQLIDCRELAGDMERLACYDARIAALVQAEQREEVVIAEPGQVRALQNERSVKEREPEFEPLESTLRAMSRSGSRLILVLADGGLWRQVDTRPTYPVIGQKVRIREAALGSYLATIGGGPAIRVRPIRE